VQVSYLIKPIEISTYSLGQVENDFIKSRFLSRSN
jgi:hypothetical protein